MGPVLKLGISSLASCLNDNNDNIGSGNVNENMLKRDLLLSIQDMRRHAFIIHSTHLELAFYVLGLLYENNLGIRFWLVR